MAVEASFIDADFHRQHKHGQFLPGDVWLSRRLVAEDRVVSVLADGLGSGVKANVLATLTATMALKHSCDDRDPRQCAATIMRSLPECAVRHISYSTFTILDVAGDGQAKVVEYGNPPTLLVRGGAAGPLPSELIDAGAGPGRELRAAVLRLEPGDRLVCLSDGVTQAGLGGGSMPLGWGLAAVAQRISALVSRDAALSARDLARLLVHEALTLDGGAAADDITCGVVHVRTPRHLLVVTGAPYDEARDGALAALVGDHPGRCAICGGTTAEIIARELDRRVVLEMGDLDPEIPPTATMDGIDLVSEGMVTLAKTMALLESGDLDGQRRNGATRLVELFLDSDIIEFRVGTRINAAHQDPELPMELGIRRNLIQRMAQVLRDRYTKEVRIAFI